MGTEEHTKSWKGGKEKQTKSSEGGRKNTLNPESGERKNTLNPRIWLEELLGWRKFIIIDLKRIEPQISLFKS